MIAALSNLKLLARVAEGLNITQPAVSKQIAELEKIVGIRTGKITGLFVVDIDQSDTRNGELSFVALGLGDPVTCQTLTQSGGRHFIFKKVWFWLVQNQRRYFAGLQPARNLI